jgi:hypothetical protein
VVARLAFSPDVALDAVVIDFPQLRLLVDQQDPDVMEEMFVYEEGRANLRRAAEGC